MKRFYDQISDTDRPGQSLNVPQLLSQWHWSDRVLASLPCFSLSHVHCYKMIFVIISDSRKFRPKFKIKKLHDEEKMKEKHFFKAIWSTETVLIAFRLHLGLILQLPEPSIFFRNFRLSEIMKKHFIKLTTGCNPKKIQHRIWLYQISHVTILSFSNWSIPAYSPMLCCNFLGFLGCVHILLYLPGRLSIISFNLKVPTLFRYI